MPRELTLYHAYTACTRVTLTALEQVGVPYADRMLDMAEGEHRSTEYLAVNPQGKVPALVVDGQLLTENGAIFVWLDETWPEAGLLPRAGEKWERAQHLSDLFWVASSWHPSVRANKAPFLWTTGDVEPVRERGRELLMGVVRQLDEAMWQRPWWYGEEWSILDTYFWWAYINAEFGGFPLEGLEGIAAHRARNEAHPALRRALARERAAFETMQAAKA